MDIKITQETKQKKSWSVFAYIIFLMSVSVYISVKALLHQSLRLDESQSLWQSSHDIRGLLEVVAQDVHLPLYHIMLHYWQIIFGNSVANARIISLVFFVLTIPAVYFLGAKILNKKLGIFVATLIAFSPFMGWYGSEVRMYSMLAFFTVLNQYFFVSLLKKSKRYWWVGYFLTSLIGAYTHYFFSLVLVTQALFVLVVRKSLPKYTFLKMLISDIAVMFSLVPWSYYVYRLGLAQNTKPSLHAPTTVDLFNTFSQFVFGFQVDAVNTVIVSLWPLATLLLFLALQKKKKIPDIGWYFLLAAIFPVVFAFIFSVVVQPLFLSRYLIVSLPALFLFLGMVFLTYPKKLAGFLQGGFLLLVASMFLVQIVNNQIPVKEDYRAAADYLKDRSSASDIIIVSAPFTVYPLEYYYQGSSRIQTLPLWDRFGNGPIPHYVPDQVPGQVKELQGSHERAWLILSDDQGYEEDIKQYFDTHYQRLAAEEFSPNVRLYEYQLRYDPPVTIETVKQAQLP